MDGKEIKVAVPENYDGKPIVLIIREGDAEVVNNRVGKTHNVSIISIKEFVAKRQFDKDPKKNPGVVYYCIHPDRPSLSLDLNPHDDLEPELKGVLKINPDLEAFRINKDYFFSNEELKKFVLKYSHCFSSMDDAKQLRKDLANFIVKYEQTIEKADDRLGNTKDLVEASIKINKGMFPLQWKLTLPLFLGGKKASIEVEIEIEKRDNGKPGFGFYSLELETVLRQYIEETILKEVETLEPLFPCLQLD